MSQARVLRTITVLPVHDVAAVAEWYSRALGFETIYLHEGATADEVTNYAIVVRDGVAVHLILDEPPPYREPWSHAGTGYLMLMVSDINAMYAEVLGRGIEPSRGLQMENWGARGFNLNDPSGNAVHIEQER